MEIETYEKLATKHDLLLSDALINFADDLWKIAKEDECLSDKELQIEIDNLRSELQHFYRGGR